MTLSFQVSFSGYGYNILEISVSVYVASFDFVLAQLISGWNFKE
jgi:hypothetical protein